MEPWAAERSGVVSLPSARLVRGRGLSRGLVDDDNAQDFGACGGGTGLTRTALAALARYDGLPADEAVPWVCTAYRRGRLKPRGSADSCGRISWRSDPEAIVFGRVVLKAYYLDIWRDCPV